LLWASDDKLLPGLGLVMSVAIRGSLAGKGIRIVGIASPLENRVNKDRTLSKY
jgi:hypothetical protein